MTREIEELLQKTRRSIQATERILEELEELEAKNSDPGIIIELIKKSHRSLQVSKRLLDESEWLLEELEAKAYDFDISRAYYAMFYSAQAALLSNGLEYSSHVAVVARFGQYFIKPNILPRKFGKAFAKAFRLRMESDYEVSMPSAAGAESILNDALEFVSGIAFYLARETEVEN